jgi:outer membrane protein assembly factor BamE
LALVLLLPLVAGCSSWGFPGVYKINVEQGNIVTIEMLEQLEPGMNRRQVRYILGTPLIEDPFNQDRWEYLYMVRNGENTLVDQRLTVYFEGDALTHWDSNHPLAGQEEDSAESTTADASEQTQDDT